MIFCPSAISCIFSPKIEKDPLNSGSMGVGFTINKGVIAKPSSGVMFNGKKIDFPTVEFVLKENKMDGVELLTELPLGCGFGLSGASALATAFLCEKPAVELYDLAHVAEVVNLTGLGTVATQTFSGLVIRKSASCPSKIVVERYAWNYELDFISLGSISTREVLTTRKNISEIGKKWLREFMKKVTLENLFRCSKAFAEETGLIEPVKDIVEAVESNGGMASMAMLGKTVFAYNGYEALEEFGKPFKARIECIGVRKVESLGNSVQNR
ncbi:MAG: pantoate kinase [Archaeoglobaceae archaeon]|nr:pantoate kinase [Archaeoglobaceae archaeon]MDW8118342.1 pantoate kinase [Archaeoglobaceae archaeon]